MMSRRRLAALDRAHHLADVDGFQINVAIDEQAGIDRNQIVRAAIFDAVPGIIDHGPVGAIGGPGEIAQRGHDLVALQIGLQSDRLESRVAQGCGKCGGVVLRIGERRHMLVSAVADEQGDAPAERRRDRGSQWRRNGRLLRGGLRFGSRRRWGSLGGLCCNLRYGLLFSNRLFLLWRTVSVSAFAMPASTHF
jgi:hypothetical protein